jgi:hypothetical protein
MIKPTIGRIVWYWEGDRTETSQPHAAIVTYVWTDRMVNLAVFDEQGNQYNSTSVKLVQAEDEVAGLVGTSYAEWMPYQIGQAKKHDENAPGSSS